MTKTSYDVYMLFTQFVNLNNVYEVLFIICNTDTNLYDFYIYKKKKSNFFPGWIYSLHSFMNKHVYSTDVKFDLFFLLLLYLTFLLKKMMCMKEH